MQKQLHLVSVSITALMGLLFVGLQPFPILHDFPEWMYQGWLVSQLWAPSSAMVSEQFSLVTYPVPNSISQLMIGLLNQLVSPVTAGKIWLGIYFVFSAVLWWLVSKKRGGDESGAVNLLLTLTITLGPGFWNGYANFQFGLLFFGLYLYVAIIRNRPSAILVLVSSLFLFFSHAVVFAAFVFFVFFQYVKTSARWRAMAALLPSLVLLLWYMKYKLSAVHTIVATPLSWSKWVQYKAYTLAKQGPFHNFIMQDGESLLAALHPLYLTGFIINFLLVILLMVWLTTLARKLFRNEEIVVFPVKPPEQLALVCTSIGLLVVFLVAGQNTFGVVNIGERFMVVALMLALMFFGLPALLRQIWSGAGIICMLFLMVASVVVTNSGSLQYSVARSASEVELEKFVDDIYANSRHKYFNHRLFIYADRGQELRKENPRLLPIDLVTSIVAPRR